MASATTERRIGLPRLKNMRVGTKLALVTVLAALGFAGTTLAAAVGIHDSILTERKAQAQIAVQTTIGLVQSYVDAAQNGQMDQAIAQKLAAQTVSKLRYGTDGYFWIQDTSPKMVMHPNKPELDGQDLSSIADTDGQHHYVSVARAARTGGGFVQYLYKQPKTSVSVPKIAYVAYVPAWDWAIASGIYVDDVTSTATAQALRIAAVALVLLLVIGVVSWFIRRNIVSRLHGVVAVMTRAAEGDLSARAQADGRDEVAEMVTSMNHTLDRIGSVIGTVSAVSRQIGDNSGGLSAASVQLGATAERTSQEAATMTDTAGTVDATVATLAAGMEQMSASITEVARNAEQAALTATEGVLLAGSADESVGKLGSSSAEIGTIIKVITSIAEQTNLLALNATIEAARAGEAGRGFAVVAGEVKDLAQETARAAHDITARVEAIQADTDGAVSAIRRISEVIGDISSYQTTIASAVEEQTATASELSRSLLDASMATSQLAGAVGTVADGAVETHQGVRTVRDTSGELADVSRKLTDVVAVFATR